MPDTNSVAYKGELFKLVNYKLNKFIINGITIK